MSRTIAIPESLPITAQSLDDLEDWLAANAPAFIAEIRRIRTEEHLAGQGKDLAELLARCDDRPSRGQFDLDDRGSRRVSGAASETAWSRGGLRNGDVFRDSTI